MKKIYIVSATSKQNKEDTLIWESIKKLIDCNIIGENDYEIVVGNHEGLATLYNKYLTPEHINDYVIFVHDDVTIEDINLKEKLIQGFSVSPILGVAGCDSPLHLNRPPLWHLLGDKEHLKGEVSHYITLENDVGNDPLAPSMTTQFGVPWGNVVLLDGVFIAVDVEKIFEVLKFDESCPAKFHFYDLNFCAEAASKQIGMRVTTIRIIHKSHGLEHLTDDWTSGAEYFMQKIRKIADECKQ